jgi:hypothetical protein
MSRPYLWALWPVALAACSTSSATTQQSAGATGASSGSTSGNQGGSGSGSVSASGSVSGSGAGASGSIASTGGSSAGSPILDAGASGGDAATDAAVAEEGESPDGGACAGLFCEDFETGMLDMTKWVPFTGGQGTWELEQQIVSHGNWALHVHGTGTGSGASRDFATILTKSAPAALQGPGPVFGRAYLYASANTNPHCQLVLAGTNPVDPTVTPSINSNGMNFNYMEFAEFGGGSWQLGFDLFAPAPAVANGFVEEASYTHPTMQAPVMKWSCIEWEFNDNPTMMLLWVDGTQIDQFDVDHIDYHSVNVTQGSVLNGKTSGIIGGFTVFGFGVHEWGDGSPFDYYYDDIVLDTKRVNCPQ